MESIPKLLGKFLLVAAGAGAVLVLFLEIGSRTYTFPEVPEFHGANIVCDPTINPPRPEKVEAVQELVARKRPGVEPSREDLDRAMVRLDYDAMRGLNGVICNGVIYVRANLGREGQYFVARHELSHMFIHTGVESECTQGESCPTWIAARQYPIGFVETVVSSLVISFRESPSVWHFLFGSWKIFKAYLLP